MGLTVKDYLERPIAVLVKEDSFDQKEFNYAIKLYTTSVSELMKKEGQNDGPEATV